MKYLVEINYERTDYSGEYDRQEDINFAIGLVEAEDENLALILTVEKLGDSNQYLNNKGIKDFNYSNYDFTPLSQLIDINQ